MKIHLLYITLCSLTQAAYISRLSNLNRLRAPAVYRPGVMLRPWMHQRLVPAASHRAPYVVYRGPLPHRYAMKHFNPGVRNVFSGGPWKAGRLPLTTSEYELIRPASAPPVLQSHGGTGAIHTIPAPNLSLSEKPIVVVDTPESNAEAASEAPKTTYEVTEQYSEPPVYQVPAKIESPTGFSKQSSLTTPELQQFVQNGASFPLSPQFGVPSLPLPQNAIVPQQFSLQGFTELSGHQDLLQTAAEGIVIPPSALYQSDPNFLQKLQNQLLQQFPSVEFIPYAADVQPQIQQTSAQPGLYLLQDEVLTQQTPVSFKSSEQHRNIVQRETQEESVASLVPQAFTPRNVTEDIIDVATLSASPNVTLEIITLGTEQPVSTEKQTAETTTEEHKTTPLYYAQVGESVGDIIAKGFYSAINDVRAAAALAQVENGNNTVQEESVTSGKVENKNETSNEVKQVNNQIQPRVALGGKSTESPNVVYTLARTHGDTARPNKEGNVYAGQLVQAMVSDDKDYNKGKVNPVSWRPPVRLFAIQEKKADIIPQKLTAVKAKIPPKSKLTFDDKTGEPVLRIYASYSENPIQKEVLLSKLSSMKHFKEVAPRKQDTVDNLKTASTKSFEKNIPNDGNQPSQFDLKFRSRSDDYIPLYEDYEE